MTSQQKAIRIILFFFVFTIISFRMWNISVLDEGRGRNQIYGDGFSDINTYSSALWFRDSGFTKTAFLPMHDYKIPGREPIIYTHYPALPNILAGFYATVFNTENESVLRIIPFLLAIVFFFFIFRVYNTLIPDKRIAFTGAAGIVLSNYFIAWADNLHQHLYGEMLKWIFLYLIYTYYEGGKKETGKLWLMMLVMLLQINISFEHPVYIGMLSACFAVIYDRNPFTKETIGLFLAMIAGFALHFYQNVIYFGSFDIAYEDMKNALVLRTSGEASSGIVSEAHLGISALWEIPFTWINRMERYFVFPGWFMLILLYPAMKSIRQSSKSLYAIVWSLLIASVAWSFVMPQHSFVHTFTCKHFGIWYGIVLAYGLTAYTKMMKEQLAGKKYFYFAVNSIACLYAAAMFLTQQVYYLYLKFGLLYPSLGK